MSRISPAVPLMTTLGRPALTSPGEFAIRCCPRLASFPRAFLLARDTSTAGRCRDLSREEPVLTRRGRARSAWHAGVVECIPGKEECPAECTYVSSTPRREQHVAWVPARCRAGVGLRRATTSFAARAELPLTPQCMKTITRSAASRAASTAASARYTSLAIANPAWCGRSSTARRARAPATGRHGDLDALDPGPRRTRRRVAACPKRKSPPRRTRVSSSPTRPVFESCVLLAIERRRSCGPQASDAVAATEVVSFAPRCPRGEAVSRLTIVRSAPSAATCFARHFPLVEQRRVRR